MSVTHGQCDARPTVTFPAYAATKFILLGNSLAAQDINPIAYAPEFTWPNFHAQAMIRTKVGTLASPASTYLA